MKHDKYYEVNSLPSTSNPSYNTSWQTLARYFKEAQGLPRPNLCLDTNHPKTRGQWLEVCNALIEVISIGRRQGWLRIEVDGKGNLVFLLHLN